MKWYSQILMFTIYLLSFPSFMNAQTDLLKDYRWENRVILLFTPDESNAAFKKQQRIILNDKEGYLDRDLVVLTYVIGDVNSQSLREKYSIKNDLFSFVLIGKDGYEKLTSNKVVASKNLFNLIDSMPMRISEMKDGKIKK